MSDRKTQPSSIDRRRFLQYTWSGVGASLSLALLPGRDLFAAPRFGDNPFTLGVASGDPTPDGIVLWTRLAPEPADPDEPRQVGRFRSAGASPPTAACATSWRAASRSRPPSSRIRCTSRWTACGPAATTSISSTCAARRAPSATFRTAPAPHEMARELRFAFATCQDWPSGYYTAYRDMLQNDLDLVLHLGDYTYEYAIGDSTRRGIPVPEGFERGDRRPAHLPPAPHALQARSRSAGRAREVPVRRDLGRPRGAERLLRARARVGRRRRRSSRRGARPPTRRTTSTCRSACPSRGGRARAAHLSPAALRQARRVHDARRSPVPVRQSVRRRRVAALRGGADRELHDARARAGAVGGARLRALARALEHRRRSSCCSPSSSTCRIEDERYWNDAWDGYPLARKRLLDRGRRRRPAGTRCFSPATGTRRSSTT